MIEKDLLYTLNMNQINTTNIVDLIEKAQWREATTYRETWPHEYIMSHDDLSYIKIFKIFIERFKKGEGTPGKFFKMDNWYLFLGNRKYWFMTHYDKIDLNDGQNYALNRAVLFRDRRDFAIIPGDTYKQLKQ